MSTNAEPVDRLAEIERLAALDSIDYEVARSTAAKRLGMRANILDNEVVKKRRKLGLVTTIDEGQGRAVVFADPMPWHEPVNGDALVTGITHAIKTYAVLRDAEADAIAFWILHTWLVNSFVISPRLAVTSPTKGCGKTTILRLLDKLARRPKRAGSISPPALFRAIEMFQPTLLLDENEKYLEHGGDLHALINEGHCAGATVLRVLGDKLELREFSIFGALAFARNGKVPDDLEQRSIVVVMQRRKSTEALQELRDDRCEALAVLASKCARWADDNIQSLKNADPEMGELINRNADNWRPLFAIADLIGGGWPEDIRAAARAMAPQEADAFGTKLLIDIKVTFDDRNADRLSSEDICEALAAMEGRPWAELGNARKPISKNQLARFLNDFHIKPDTIRVGTKTIKGYLRLQFEEAWQRYLTPHTPQGVCETSQRNNPNATGTSGTFQTVTEKGHVTFRKYEKPASNGHCYGVTVQNGEKALYARGCDHCQASGTDADPLLEVADGRGGALLHRACINAWHAGEIPGFLDRRGAA